MGAGGKGLSFDGVIIDENNDSIARFQSLQFGMGSFSFTPLLNHTYKAIVTVGEHTFTNALPQIYAQGYIMQLHTADKTHLTVTVQTNITDPGNLFLLVHTRQSLKTVLQSEMEKGKASFDIDPAKLGDGISQFTIFNNKGKPVCERLYFTYPAKPLSIQVTGNLPIYTTRSRIDLSIEPVGQPKTDMSVAV